jgi:hypothetical protein
MQRQMFRTLLMAWSIPLEEYKVFNHVLVFGAS